MTGRTLAYRVILSLAVATAAARVLPAQTAMRIPVQAGATIDRDSVTVGDIVRLTVRVRGPRGATINFPAAVDSLGPVQSLEPPTVRDGVDTIDAADRIAVYRLVPWDIGSLPIRLGEVLVQTDDDERRVTLPLPTLFVRSVLPADTTLRVPKPARPLLPVRAPFPWWWWLLAALAAIAIGVGAWWWARRRGRDTGPTGDPYGDAERAFERIERMRLVESGESGRHAALMTDVLRRYLAARVETAPLALTSVELLRALRTAPGIPHDRLGPLLEALEPIKFGAAPVTADEARRLGSEARSIVKLEHDQAIARAAAAAAESRDAAA